MSEYLLHSLLSIFPPTIKGYVEHGAEVFQKPPLVKVTWFISSASRLFWMFRYVNIKHVRAYPFFLFQMPWLVGFLELGGADPGYIKKTILSLIVFRHLRYPDFYIEEKYSEKPYFSGLIS